MAKANTIYPILQVLQLQNVINLYKSKCKIYLKIYEKKFLQSFYHYFINCFVVFISL